MNILIRIKPGGDRAVFNYIHEAWDISLKFHQRESKTHHAMLEMINGREFTFSQSRQFVLYLHWLAGKLEGNNNAAGAKTCRRTAQRLEAHIHEIILAEIGPVS